jgi:hypothetical protein
MEILLPIVEPLVFWRETKQIVDHSEDTVYREQLS